MRKTAIIGVLIIALRLMGCAASRDAVTEHGGPAVDAVARDTRESPLVPLPSTEEVVGKRYLIVTKPPAQGLGRTRSQIVGNLTEFFPRLEPSTPVNGMPRLMGQTVDRLATMEIIGATQDVYSASVMIGVPSETPEILVRNAGICLILLKNALPQWSAGPDWFNSTLQTVTTSASETSEETQVGDATVTLIFVKQFGICTLSVKQIARQPARFEAEYVSCDNGIVTVRDRQDVLHNIPVEVLSDADQEYIAAKSGYTVIQAHRLPGIKVSLDVRLSERVTKERLTEIGEELRSHPNNQAPRTFITYYLPTMQIGHGAWATSHFNPKLEVKIIGTTKEEQERLAQEASLPVAEDVLGRWMDNETAFPGLISFVKEDGKVFMTKTFQDGSKGRYEMVAHDVRGQTRYRKKDSRTSDYFVITASGDLAHGDDEGIWATSKRAR